MIAWLYAILFTGRWCSHIYDIENKGVIASPSKDKTKIGGYYYILRCTKCGNMKLENFS